MIEISGLHYRYADGTVALRGLDLSVPDGEFLLVCGPNGSGKTTLIRLVCGLLQPTAGTVSIDGLDGVGDQRAVRQRVGIVFQDADSQILGETVREDIAFGPENMRLSRAEVESRVAAAMEQLQLTGVAEKPCHLLSGGEKRRLAIAGVLAMRPRILVFDEPFANLDYPGTCTALEQILNLHRQGHTVLLTTHDVERVIAHVDRIAILFAGRIEALGLAETVIHDLRHYHIRPPCFHILGGRTLSWLSD